MASSGGFLATSLSISPSAFIAPGAVLVGQVAIGEFSSVWYGCVLRGDIEPIRIGARSNVQDGTVVHVDEALPTIVGDDVTIGHRAVIHGAVLEDGCLIGMGAVVLSGARVGAGALVAAGALVRERFVVPPRTLVAGVPAKIVGELDEGTLERMAANGQHYVEYAQAYLAGRLGGGPHGGR
ncbi:MAG: gamma carbonic anhydrase family protein [Acidobacteria bacterium]|nr:gamma carbonic anhydrase family protein [Acidobacteriota bacterium]